MTVPDRRSIDVPRSSYRVRRLAPAVLAVLVLVAGCGFPGLQKSSPSASPSTSQGPQIASMFTQDGTFQSHTSSTGLDFELTMYPTKATPRTHEWYPLGNKYFTFTFQAYDLSVPLRSPFAQKRKVYLGRVAVTSATTSTSGTVESPYTLDEQARRVTFDPEPATSRYGMLITSPKGSFELRNQVIGSVASDTYGVTLTFTFNVYVESKAGGTKYVHQTINQQVPIAIFPSKTPTVTESVPADAN